MNRAPKQTTIKPSANPAVENPSVANDISVAELQSLHEGFAALRNEDDATEGAEKNERKSVRALIAYAACDLGVNEDVVRAQVERHFELSDINELRSGHRDDLVRFLENLDIKQFIN